MLVNLGSVMLDVDHRQVSALLDAHAFAEAVGEKHEAARALGNLGYALMSWAQPEPALRYARQALAYAEQNEVYNLASYIAVTLAWLQLRAGEWDEAERITRAELEKSVSVTQLVAKTVLAELAVRRGDRGCRRAARRPRRRRPSARASRSGWRRSSSWRPSGR